MSKNYSVRLRCPYGDTDTWVILEKRSETLEEVLGASWDFECEAHGVQREIPMEATAVGPVLGPAPEATVTQTREPNQLENNKVSSECPPVRVPVVVYGWSKHHGTFHEETSTLEANASGALVPMTTKLEIGESCILLNKATHKEQEVRIVHIDSETAGETRVGIAFRQPAPEFWKAARRKPRIPAVFRVHVTGVDGNGNPFAQTAYTVNISENGARLDGVGCLTRPGQVIQVKRRWHGKARYRVVWVGQIGQEQANQIGICCLESDKNIWGVVLRESEADEPDEDSAPSKKRKQVAD